MQYLIAFCSRSEAAGDAISGRFVWPVVLDKHLKLHDPSLNNSHEILPEAVGGGISDCFPYNFRPEVDNGVVSGAAVDNVGTDVSLKFCGSRSNGFRAIRGADFVSNPNSAKHAEGFAKK